MNRSDDFRVWATARREPLRRTAFLMCGDWHLADDLTQDAMTRVYSVWSRVSKQGSPDAYARRVVVNLLIDDRRRPWRRLEVQHDTVPDYGTAPSAEADQPELVVALRALPPRQRAVLVLRYFEDRSVDEVAAILGCAPGTVKSQTSKGLVNLRAALARLGINIYPLNAKEMS